jgi:hypothetical protein
MSEKMFRFTVQNLRTKERTSFIGQGVTMEAALKDGVKNATSTRSPGKAHESEMMIACKNVEGAIANRSVSDFESDTPAIAYNLP